MIQINVHGADPEDLRAEGDGVLPKNNDSIAIANDIYELLDGEYEYLDVTGVAVDVRDVTVEEAPEFPEDN